jgi:hypothetical protein
LFPCTTLLHCSLFSPFPLRPLRHLMRLAMEKISYCKYSDWCLTDPWRRQQNDVTSVAITGGRDFRRNHIGRDVIISRTATHTRFSNFAHGIRKICRLVAFQTRVVRTRCLSVGDCVALATAAKVCVALPYRAGRLLGSVWALTFARTLSSRGACLPYRSINCSRRYCSC